MSVTSVGEHSSTRTDHEDGHRTYHNVYIVATDDKQDGPRTVINASGIPVRGEAWSYGGDTDSWAWCNKRGPAQLAEADTSKRKWHVPCEFTTRPITSPP